MPEEAIKQIRLLLKNKLLTDFKINSYDEERTQITDLLKRNIEHGESNSLLIIGPRGAGKTKVTREVCWDFRIVLSELLQLVDDVLKEFARNKLFTSNSVLVKLHGLIHTDDRLALKSITSQMQLENAVDGKVFGSFSDNLAFLLACLGTGQRDTSKGVILVLEEFDLFCAHHNQTLLYNLFDVSQSAQTPLCVIGKFRGD